MTGNLRHLSQGQRVLIFFLIFGGGIALLVAVTALLIAQALNPAQRQQAVALADDVTVREFAALPDDDAYPAAVAVGADGTVYTGSFATGVVWAIDASGSPTELPGSRDQIGAVVGLAVSPDGALYVVDQVDTDPRTSGGSVWRVSPDGAITAFAGDFDDQGFVAPDDVTLDTDGYVYVSDRGRDAVLRFDPDGQNAMVWWTPPQVEGVDAYEPTGLAYHPVLDAIIVTDSVRNTVYAIPVSDSTQTEILYDHRGGQNAPGFDGVTVTPGGDIYVAALGQNGVARVEGGELAYIAGLFRGASDVDYDPTSDLLYVTNWNQTPLVIPGDQPQLPFALDVIDLSPEG
jgi:sugar lactone lactonase YvrE